MTKRILLVDGMALLFRGYYATAYRGNFMRNDEGIPTNGVYQFLRYFLDGVKTFQPSHIFCCWDMGSKTFRTELYPTYKANRSEPPEELIPQFDLVKEVVDYFQVPNIGLKNFEADDIIGTIANRYKQDANVFILTGDYDMLQLVQENVHVALMKKGIGNYEIYDIDNFYEKRGIYPDQIIDFKGFTGDAADNYPGVRGIGEKTAVKLLQKYGSIDKIIANKDELSQGIRKKIEDDIEMFWLSQKLAEIKCDIPIQCELKEAEVDFHIDKIENRLKKLGIRIKSIREYLE